MAFFLLLKHVAACALRNFTTQPSALIQLIAGCNAVLDDKISHQRHRFLQSFHGSLQQLINFAVKMCLISSLELPCLSFLPCIDNMFFLKGYSELHTTVKSSFNF